MQLQQAEDIVKAAGSALALVVKRYTCRPHWYTLSTTRYKGVLDIDYLLFSRVGGRGLLCGIRNFELSSFVLRIA